LVILQTPFFAVASVLQLSVPAIWLMTSG